MGIVLDSTVLIAAERAGQNPRGVIQDLLAGIDRPHFGYYDIVQLL